MAKPQTLTPYDETVQTRQLMMLKTFVPYVSLPVQRQLVTMIQMLEYRTVMQALGQGGSQLSACAVPEDGNRTTALLTELRQYCSPGEQEMLDNLQSLLCIVENYEHL